MTENKTALVTGASQGIGEALARELARRGWQVIGIARSAEKLATIKVDLKDSFIPMVCDLSKNENIADISKQILEIGLRPSLFFLNAGITGDQMIETPEKLDLDLHMKFVKTNYFGVLAWVAFWEKPCKENGGAKFVVTSSLNATLAVPFRSAYCATKAAIAKAFECLSMTYENDHLQFSIVYPGPVYTDGIRGKFPFMGKKEPLAKGMVDFALSRKTRYYPSSFYHFLAVPLLRILPDKFTTYIFKKMA